MSIFFTASEILQFAIRIEENGEKFYRYAARITEDDDAKKIFEYLADEENGHKKTFEDLLSKIEEFPPLESYPGEYLAYLRAYVDNIIFTNEALDKEVSEVKDTLSAINFGIQRELDSILYYYEIKKFVPQLKEILEYFSKLDEVNTAKVKPSFQPVELKNMLREDKIKKCLSQDKALENAKEKKDGYFKGPMAV